MMRENTYLSAVLSKDTCRVPKNKESPVEPPPADGWIIFMKINTLCCNFNENWTFAARLGGWDVPLARVWLTS